MVVKESLACQTPVVSVAVGDVSTVVAGLPGCAIVQRDPEALARAVERALRAGRDPRLREAMHVYGREPIAERVLPVYRRLSRRAVRAMRDEAAQKVTFICPNLEAGGAERQWAILAPGLCERGFDVSVMTLDGRGVYFEELRARGVRIACAALRHRADPVGLARAVRLGWPRSSAVLTRGVSAHLVGHVLARRQRAAHVVTEHLGDDPLGIRPLRRHQRLLLGPMRPRANAVVAVAASQTPHLVRDGYRPDAIRVIPSGVADDPPVRDREGSSSRARRWSRCLLGGAGGEASPGEARKGLRRARGGCPFR